MSQTEHYQIPTLTESEAESVKFKDWREQINGTQADSMANIIDQQLYTFAEQIRDLTKENVILPYDATYTYALNQICHYNGALYKSLKADNLNNLPTNQTYWSLTTSNSSGEGSDILIYEVTYEEYLELVEKSEIDENAYYFIPGVSTIQAEEIDISQTLKTRLKAENVDKAIEKLYDDGIYKWSTMRMYQQNDICYQDGFLYKSLQNDNLGHEVTDNEFWIIASGNSNNSDVSVYTISNWTKTIDLEYSNLNNITEFDMRSLMDKHISADYLVEWLKNNNEVIDTFVNNDLAMKWIGICDYICDKLMAIDEFKEKALSSPYWERILKDHVPMMINSNTPYGQITVEESVDDTYVKAFDGGNSTLNVNLQSGWLSKQNYIQYKFINPICVKKFLVENLYDTDNNHFENWVLKGSNDGNSFETIASGVNTTKPSVLISVDNDKYYFYYRLEVKNSTQWVGFTTLQFYGRMLKMVNVTTDDMSIDNAQYDMDYSERTKKTYIYDNGLEIIPLEAPIVTGKAVVRKESDMLYGAMNLSSGSYSVIPTTAIDFSKFSLMRAVIGEVVYGVDKVFNVYIGVAKTGLNDVIAIRYSSNIIQNLRLDLDISNISQSAFPIFFDRGSINCGSIKEWWLE